MKEISIIQKKVEDWFDRCKSSGPMHTQKERLMMLFLMGLDRRALRLLRASDDEWLKWLDDDDFWKPGWRDEPRGEVE